MAALIKLQEESKVPINLNIQMNVDEKQLAQEMMRKMNVPIPDAPKIQPPQPRVVRPQKLRVDSSSDDSSSSDESSDSSDTDKEAESSKFKAVQRYKHQKPLTLKPD